MRVAEQESQSLAQRERLPLLHWFEGPDWTLAVCGFRQPRTVAPGPAPTAGCDRCPDCLRILSGGRP